jgi:DNA-binding Xre family transcriptional regulator
MAKEAKTKLGKILSEYGLKQIDLVYMIEHKTGKWIPPDRISLLVSGKQTNVELDTLRTIAKTLEVSVTEIIDDDI